MTNWKSYVDVDNLLDRAGLYRKSQVSSGFGSFFFGLGVGILGGCASALLLTPFSGSEAREKLARASSDLGHTISGKVTELTKTIQGSTQEPITSYSSSGSSLPSTGYSSGSRIGT